MSGVVVDRVGRVLWVRLARPHVLNALAQAEIDELAKIVAGPAAEPQTGAVVVTGTGRAFCAGADLEALRGIDPTAMGRLVSSGQGLMRSLERLDRPVVAAVNGAALGGGLELALACDIRLASENAIFALPEVSIGTVPGWGGTHRLTHAVGGSSAAYLILSGQPIDARRAHELGLVTEVHPGEALEEAAQALAERLASMEPVAVGGAKRALLASRSAAGDAASAAERSAVLASHRHATRSPFTG